MRERFDFFSFFSDFFSSSRADVGSDLGGYNKDTQWQGFPSVEEALEWGFNPTIPLVNGKMLSAYPELPAPEELVPPPDWYPMTKRDAETGVRCTFNAGNNLVYNPDTVDPNRRKQFVFLAQQAMTIGQETMEQKLEDIKSSYLQVREELTEDGIQGLPRALALTSKEVQKRIWGIADPPPKSPRKDIGFEAIMTWHNFYFPMLIEDCPPPIRAVRINEVDSVPTTPRIRRGGSPASSISRGGSPISRGGSPTNLIGVGRGEGGISLHQQAVLRPVQSAAPLAAPQPNREDVWVHLGKFRSKLFR